MCLAVARTIPRLASVAFLLAMHIFLFGVIGFIAFSAQGVLVPDSPGFASLPHAWLSLFILLTSSTYADLAVADVACACRITLRLLTEAPALMNA